VHIMAGPCSLFLVLVKRFPLVLSTALNLFTFLIWRVPPLHAQLWVGREAPSKIAEIGPGALTYPLCAAPGILTNY
jgi:hypothetical protein